MSLQPHLQSAQQQPRTTTHQRESSGRRTRLERSQLRQPAAQMSPNSATTVTIHHSCHCQPSYCWPKVFSCSLRPRRPLPQFREPGLEQQSNWERKGLNFLSFDKYFSAEAEHFSLTSVCLCVPFLPEPAPLWGSIGLHRAKELDPCVCSVLFWAREMHLHPPQRAGEIPWRWLLTWT